MGERNTFGLGDEGRGQKAKFHQFTTYVIQYGQGKLLIRQSCSPCAPHPLPPCAYTFIIMTVFCGHTQDAMGVLGMPEEERTSMLRVVAGVLHFGNIEVKQRPREEWATIPTATGQSHSLTLLNSFKLP